MKSIKLIFALVITATILNGCCFYCNDPAPGSEEVQYEALSGIWELDFVTKDGIDITDDWAGFTLDISKALLVTKNSIESIVWHDQIAWDFQGSTGAGLNNLVRADGVVMEITNITTQELTLTFTIVPPTTTTIDGEYVFIMRR